MTCYASQVRATEHQEMADPRKLLKILHVASHDAIRAGGSIQMMRLAIGLRERGHTVVCVFNKRDDAPDTFGILRDAGIPVYRFPMQKLKKYYGMLRFRQFFLEHKFDVVHAHRFRALRFVLAATRGMAIPALIGDRKNSFPVPRSWARLYGNRRVDALVVNATLIKDLLIKTGQVQPDKIEIIYNGVDIDQFHPDVDGSAVRGEFGIGSDTPLVGMIANFSGKKSHGVFFDAALEVLGELPQTRFLLVGGGESTQWQRRLSEQGILDRCIFTGFRTDIPQIIASLNVSVISSSSGEGLTGSIVESMAMAKPVVSTAIAGNAEFIRDRQTGMLVPPGDPHALGAAILYLLRNPDEAAKIGKQAAEFVRDRVDNRKRSERFEALYYNILRRKGIW